MINILDLNLKKNKKLIFLLKDTYGLGQISARKLCKDLGYDYNIKVSQFRTEDLNKLTALISVKYKFIIGAELKKKIYDRIQNMKNIRCYKGVRHSYGLPVNSQRTRTNAKTRGWR